tara:strand:- start:289 stop:3666 length:3378 start_codon:yes stop_codon:yes gene_type:complete
MATNTTPSAIRGFLLPYEFTTDSLWGAQSTYTEASKSAGDAIASTGSKLIVDTFGDQTTAIDLLTDLGGTPGQRGGFIWRESAGPSAYYGQTSPQALTGYEVLRYGSTGAPIVTCGPPSALALSDGSILVAYEEDGAIGSGIYVDRKLPGATTYSGAVQVYNNAVAPVQASHPAMCELLDGSVLLVHWASGAGLFNDSAQFYSYRSTDQGATWTRISTGALRSPSYVPINPVLITNVLGRIHLAQYQGQVMLMAEIVTSVASAIKNVIYQAASVDGGASFVQIGDYTENENFYAVSLFSTDQGFGFTTVKYLQATGTYTGYYANFPHAFYPVAQVAGLDTYVAIKSGMNGYTLVGGTPNEFNYGASAGWSDSAGVLYAVFSSRVTMERGAIFMLISEDDGSTWSPAGQMVTGTQDKIFNVDTLTTTPTNLSGINGAGRNMIYCNFAANPGTADNSVVCLIMGGWSELCLPPTMVGRHQISRRAGYYRSWLPFDTPDTSALYTAAGGGAASLDSDGLKLVSTNAAGQEKTYQYSIRTSDQTMGCYFRFVVIGDQQGDIGSDDTRGANLFWDDGTFRFEFTIRISTTEILLRDVVGAADKATATPTPAGVISSDGLEVIAAVHRQTPTNTVYVSVWYRGADQKTPKGWHTLISRGTIATGATGVAQRYIKFGHLGKSPHIANMISHFREFCTNTEDGDLGLSTVTTPEKTAAIYPRTGDRMYVNEGLFISTKDGPALEGDTYSITPRSAYPIDRIFYKASPSPRVKWQSNSVAAGTPVPENFIALLYDPDIETQDTDLGSDLLGVHLAGINFRQFRIEGRTGGAWTTLATVDTSAGNFSFTAMARNGITVQASDPLSIPYLFNDELRNFIVQTEAGPNEFYRTVATNSEGRFNSTMVNRRSVVRLEQVETTDPTTGVLKIIPDRVTVVVSLNGQKFSALGIRITSQKTRDDDFRIGQLLAGPVHIVAPQYGRGRSITYEPNTETFEDTDGTIRSRKRGPGRRVLSVSWSDPVDMSSMFPLDVSDTDPNYWMARDPAGGLAVANYGGVPFDMMGYSRTVGGSDQPVVYIPRLPTAGGPVVHLLRRECQHLPGLIDSDITIDHVVGDELTGDNQGEAFRIATIQIREIT